MLRNRIQAENIMNDEDRLKYYSAWHFGAIRRLLGIPEMRTKQKLVRYLKLPPEFGYEALNFLTKSRLFWSKNQIGRRTKARLWRNVDKRVDPLIEIERRVLTWEKVVLVIDDNPDILELNRTILEMEGFKVFTALDGSEALRILSENSPPDLILLDMKMEDMSGPDFLLLLEARRPEIVKTVPIVFLTAMEAMPPSKAIGIIRKPFDVDTFVKSVRSFAEMGTAVSHNEH